VNRLKGAGPGGLFHFRAAVAKRGDAAAESVHCRGDAAGASGGAEAERTGA
jgi:hypothetical protein